MKQIKQNKKNKQTKKESYLILFKCIDVRPANSCESFWIISW